MARVLTAAAVERFKHTGKRRWIRDGGAQSLYLVIQASGHRSWAMRFRRPDGNYLPRLPWGPVDLSGRELKPSPGSGMPLSLVGARQLAASHPPRSCPWCPDVIADHKARRHRQRAEIKEHADNAPSAPWSASFVDEHARIKTRKMASAAPCCSVCAIPMMVASPR